MFKDIQVLCSSYETFCLHCLVLTTIEKWVSGLKGLSVFFPKSNFSVTRMTPLAHLPTPFKQNLSEEDIWSDPANWLNTIQFYNFSEKHVLFSSFRPKTKNKTFY